MEDSRILFAMNAEISTTAVPGRTSTINILTSRRSRSFGDWIAEYVLWGSVGLDIDHQSLSPISCNWMVSCDDGIKDLSCHIWLTCLACLQIPISA